jgi:zinc-finger of a C2HC-type
MMHHGGSRRAGVPAACAGGAGGEAELEACGNCGRTFKPDVLLRHGRVCTADKPMKPLRKPAAGAATASTSAEPASEPAEAPGTIAAARAQPSAASKYASAAVAAAAEAAVGGGEEGPQELQQCEGCGRTFAPAALARHANVCAKVFKTKRKPLDASAQCLAGAHSACHAKSAAFEQQGHC